MTETEFILSIDCDFPYFVEKDWKEVINVGVEISDNAAFMILSELCRIPYSVKIDLIDLSVILEYFVESYNHPLLDTFIEVAKVMMNNKTFPCSDAISKMKLLLNYPGQYNALSILSSSCAYDEIIDDEREKVIAHWQNQR